MLEDTGGESFEVKDVLHMDTIFRELIDRIKTRYTLGYYLPADASPGKLHKLDVQLNSTFGTKGKNYTVIAKSGYLSP